MIPGWVAPTISPPSQRKTYTPSYAPFSAVASEPEATEGRLRMIENRNVVVLDAGFQPLNIVSARDALRYLMSDKATVVEADDEAHIPGFGPAPKVIAFRYSVPWIWSHDIAWSRRKMLERDNYICAYCGKHGKTVDHILPQSRGGRDSWMNTVAACNACNGKKDNKTPEEAHMPLRYQPYVLTRREMFRRRIASAGVSLDWL